MNCAAEVYVERLAPDDHLRCSSATELKLFFGRCFARQLGTDFGAHLRDKL